VDAYQVFVVVAKDTRIASKVSKPAKLAARMEASNLLQSVAELASVLSN
jgi:hypothetical protein